MAKKVGCKPHGFAIIEKNKIKEIYIYCDKKLRDSAYSNFMKYERPFDTSKDYQKIDGISTVRSMLKRE